MHLPTTKKSEVLCPIATATSKSDPHLDWRAAIQDTAQLDIKRFALFLTGLKPAERKECYRLFLSHRLRHEFEIPFVHACGDMQPDEYRLIMDEFNANRFNLHRSSQRPIEHPLSPEVLSRIYIENAWRLEASDLAGFAGICLDFSHMEAVMYEEKTYYQFSRACSNVSLSAPTTSAPSSPGRKPTGGVTGTSCPSRTTSTILPASRGATSPSTSPSN